MIKVWGKFVGVVLLVLIISNKFLNCFVSFFSVVENL